MEHLGEASHEEVIQEGGREGGRQMAFLVETPSANLEVGLLRPSFP